MDLNGYMICFYYTFADADADMGEESLQVCKAIANSYEYRCRYGSMESWLKVTFIYGLLVGLTVQKKNQAKERMQGFGFRLSTTIHGRKYMNILCWAGPTADIGAWSPFKMSVYFMMCASAQARTKLQQFAWSVHNMLEWMVRQMWFWCLPTNGIGMDIRCSPSPSPPTHV